MGALNFGRDPFFYSLYVGPIVLLLAAVGAFAARFRRNAVLACDTDRCCFSRRPSAVTRRSIRWPSGACFLHSCISGSR